MKLQAILSTAMVLGATAYAGDILLDGGKLVPIEAKTIEMYKDDMNFCFATRFSDGEIHLNHSKGVHTITEFQCTDWSPDDGKTWKSGKGKKIFGINSFENSKGEKVQIGCWSGEIKSEHLLTVHTESKDGKVTTTKVPVKFEIPSSFRTHREAIVLKDGTVLASAYGYQQGAKKSYAFVIASYDDGKTWEYLSALCDDQNVIEGNGESTLTQLADGSIFGAWRDGGTLKYRFSKDNGKTWGEVFEYKELPLAVSPQAKVLSNGALVVLTGRPFLHLLVDWTGSGKEFQKVDIYNGSGSSYGTIFEIAPNRIMIIHDESHFSAYKNVSHFSRLVAETYDIVKDDSIKATSGDPRAKGFKVFYSPFNKRNPFEENIGHFYGYKDKAKSPNALANFEIMTVPEQPYPIMRITSKGEQGGERWPTFRSHKLPADAKKLTVEFSVRIQDHGIDTPQFMVAGKAPIPGQAEGCYAASLQIGMNRVQLNGRTVYQGSLNSKFTTFVLEVDGVNKKATLFIKGDSKPLGSCNLTASTGANAVTGVWWGDGSNQINGTADLSYIGWTW
ncbi:MAG: exo-alpha-sialidase [Lentisphaeria bacterium]|nr:exo-alpha-sialidase [Lentisphaeria bacterium]